LNARINDIVVDPQHIPTALSVAGSNIRGAGLGLFSNVFILRGRPICEYKGDLLTDDQLNSMSSEERRYCLSLGDPPVLSAQGALTTVDPNPDKDVEIGYGGFTNDFYTSYPQELIDLESKERGAVEDLIVGNWTYWESFRKDFCGDPRGKPSSIQRKKIRKTIKNYLALTREAEDIYRKHNYNAAVVRLAGAPSFLLVSLNEIYPGDEIYFPYGSRYWESRGNGA